MTSLESKEFYISAGRFFAVILSIPFCVTLIGAYANWFVYFLFLLTIPLAAITLLIGAIIWLVRGIRKAGETDEMREKVIFVAASPAYLVLTLLLAWPMLFLRGYVGDLSRLAINYNRYQEIIGKAQDSGKVAWSEHDNGVKYRVDPGPPVRMAFDPTGLQGNWSGIIFDPTGEVSHAKVFDPKRGKFVTPKRIIKLFGGDLVGCNHLWGDFYACTFT